MDDDDDFNFDFESKLEQQQKTAAAAPTAGPALAAVSTTVPVNQSAGSFKRNYRQTVCTYWLKGVCALGDNCGFLHEFNAERMPVCKTLIKFGVCKEPDCPYKHTLEDIKECNMFKLGFCVYGPQCRYRHTRLPGPPPDPKDVDAAKPREFRAGGRDADKPEGGRGRGRYQPRGRGDASFSGRLPPPRPPGQIEGPSHGAKGLPFGGHLTGATPPGGPPPKGPPPKGPPPGDPPPGAPLRPPHMMMGMHPHAMGFFPPGMMGMPGMRGMIPQMNMQQFWGQRPPYPPGSYR